MNRGFMISLAACTLMTSCRTQQPHEPVAKSVELQTNGSTMTNPEKTISDSEKTITDSRRAISDSEKTITDSFFEQARSALFKGQSRQDATAFFDRCEVVTQRVQCSTAAQLVENSLTDEEKKSMILIGELHELHRDGQCWQVIASQYPWAVCGYLNDDQQLIFLWHMPEG